MEPDRIHRETTMGGFMGLIGFPGSCKLLRVATVHVLDYRGWRFRSACREGN